MNMLYESDVLERLDFMRRAADHFTKHPNHWTYANGEPKCGELFAVRWGLGKDCVLIFKISDELDPEIYAQAITHAAVPHQDAWAPEPKPGDVLKVPPDKDLRKYKGDEEWLP